ncbi:hypothetical protein SprV_0300999800 [Sparganum proliferum]
MMGTRKFPKRQFKYNMVHEFALSSSSSSSSGDDERDIMDLSTPGRNFIVTCGQHAHQIAHKDLSGALFDKATFSKIDLVGVFHQISVAPEDLLKPGVNKSFGLFEFIRMLFGLCNAAQTFRRFIDHVSRGVPLVHAYIDDFLVASQNVEGRLALVLYRLDKFGVVINPSKCVLACLSLNSLALMLTQEVCVLSPQKSKPFVLFPHQHISVGLNVFTAWLTFTAGTRRTVLTSCCLSPICFLARKILLSLLAAR